MGTKFIGEFKNGKRHGMGTSKMGEPAHSTFSGNWVNGKRHGQHVLRIGKDVKTINFVNGVRQKSVELASTSKKIKKKPAKKSKFNKFDKFEKKTKRIKMSCYNKKMESYKFSTDGKQLFLGDKKIQKNNNPYGFTNNIDKQPGKPVFILTRTPIPSWSNRHPQKEFYINFSTFKSMVETTASDPNVVANRGTEELRCMRER